MEKQNLRAKTENSRILDHWATGNTDQSADAKAAAAKWLDSGGVACGVDPVFYLQRYAPQLFSFECLPDDHEYVKHMRCAVGALGHESIFTQVCGQSFCKDKLPLDALPIDWAWNDHDRYTEFFAEFWEHLNPSGGIMIFHNVTSAPENLEPIQSMVEQRAPHGDLECLILEEPHKLVQNGCAILRRTTNYRPRFSLMFPESLPVLSRPQEILQALRLLVSG